MALTNYTTLKAAIANFLARDDLTSEIDDFIDLTEADFNRRLRIRAMETVNAAFVIDAETEAQLKQAGRVFTGDLGKKSNEWREKLTRAAALLVATIDFADEEVPDDVSSEVGILINTVANELDKEIVGVHTAERIRSGFEVAIQF